MKINGRIRVSLWQEQIDIADIEDRIKISATYVTESRNELQLNIPRSGKLEIIEEKIHEI